MAKQGTKEKAKKTRGPAEAAITRRDFIKQTAIGVAGAAAMVGGAPWVRNAKAATLELRWLGWEHYNVKSLTEEFEKTHKCKVSAGFFDGNSECYNKLRAGGTGDFDLCMADGFWPRLYAKQGLTQPVDYAKVPSMKGVFPAFTPPNYMLLQEEGGKNMIAAPNCWGGYGFTVNTDKVAPEDRDSVYLMFNPKYKGHLCVSSRFEENIALAGILVCDRLGSKTKPRPDGKSFNPYVLYDNELEECKKLLIQQKKLLVTRWQDEKTLERLLRSQVVWAAPEWSGVYRLIEFDRLDGKSPLKMTHVLQPKEGGLGWVDTWCITSGVKDPDKLALCYEWINFRLQKESMRVIAQEIGWAPTVDVRDMLPARYVETMFMNQTDAIKNLYQFDAPSSPEKWERIWHEVEAS